MGGHTRRNEVSAHAFYSTSIFCQKRLMMTYSFRKMEQNAAVVSAMDATAELVKYAFI